MPQEERRSSYRRYSTYELFMGLVGRFGVIGRTRDRISVIGNKIAFIDYFLDSLPLGPEMWCVCIYVILYVCLYHCVMCMYRYQIVSSRVTAQLTLN